MSNTEQDNATLGGRLRIAREQAGLSQGQVAKMMSLHRPSISEIEAGHRKVSANELATFADFYGVDVDWLLKGDGGHRDLARVELAARELAKMKPEDIDRLLNLLATLRTSEDSRS
jgi:transcriptional regulator with XRE-family HTH domain